MKLSHSTLHRKENKDDQLMAAQTYLKLGEVSAESGLMPVLVLALVLSKFFFFLFQFTPVTKVPQR